MIKHHFRSPLSFDSSINWISVFFIVFSISVATFYGTLLGISLVLGENSKQVLGVSEMGDVPNPYNSDMTESEMTGENLPDDVIDEGQDAQQMENYYESEQQTVEDIPINEADYPSYNYPDSN